WWTPHLAFGGRFTGGIDGGLGDQVEMWTLEPLVTVAHGGRIRGVGQVGIGVASQRLHEIPFCPLGCTTAYEVRGPWLPTVTLSVAGGLASRRSGTTVLMRLETDANGNVAVLPMVQFGGVAPVSSPSTDAG
ncbi:MAG: hypothetical protein ABMB14_06685, partial [Myxococcota bacterium]